MSSSKSDNPIGISPEQLASLDSDQAEAIFSQGKDAVVFTLLAMARQLALAGAASENPATPSGMIPVYLKPPAKKRRKKSGTKADHAGSRRARPERIDHYQTHRVGGLPRLRRAAEPVQRNSHAVRRRHSRNRTGSH